MTFRETLAQDVRDVFLNPMEFAEPRTVEYDGEIYPDIPVSLQDLEAADRERVSVSGFGRGQSDSAAGLHQVTSILFCALADLGGELPEQGKTLRVSGREGGDGWFQTYTVMVCGCDMGMLKIGLRGVEE